MKKAVLVLLILVLGILPAHAQTDFPLVKILSDGGLLNDLNLTQSKDELSVTFKWAYADENMMAMHATITGLPEPEQSTEEPLPYHPVFKLTDTDGNFFPGYANGTAVSYPGDGQIVLDATYLYYPEVILPDGETVVSDYFQFKYGDTLPETIDLHLEVSIDSTQLPEPSTGPFSFDFSVPLLPALTLEPGLRSEVNGVEVTLANLRVTPSSINATLCYDRENMGLEAVLSAADLPIQPNRLTRTEDNCTIAIFEQTGDLGDTLTLSVERLRAIEPTDDPVFWANVQAELAKQNIVIEFTDAPYAYDVISLPAGMEEYEIGAAMHEASLNLRETIEGPWTFTVSIPE